MRLFVAVELPETVRAGAAEASARLRSILARAHSRSRMTWVAPDRLHLTLLFLGEVAEEVATHMAERFAPPLPMAPFTLRLGHAGVFPPSGRPRVAWLAVEEGAGQLSTLHDSIVDRFDGLPWTREERPFAAHLTLARFRDPGTPAERRAISEAPAVPIPSGEVDHVTLFQSRLSPRGPDYTVLARATLRRPTA